MNASLLSDRNKKIVAASFFGLLTLVLIVTTFQLSRTNLDNRKSASDRNFEAAVVDSENFSLQMPTSASVPTIETFKTPYSTLISFFNTGVKSSVKRIQLFGGGLVLGEFDDANDKIYAGHLGSFWAPPYFSSHTSENMNNPEEWQKGFRAALVFYNDGFRGGTAEKPSDPATAFWYPSKLVMSQFYPGAGGGTQVDTVKVALPGQRGIGMKISLTNKSPTAQSYSTMVLATLPTFEALQKWNSSTENGWNWLNSISSSRDFSTSYDSAEDTIFIKHNPSGAVIAMTMDQRMSSWAISSDTYQLYTQFLDANSGGAAPMTNASIPNSEVANGLVIKTPLEPEEKTTFTFLMGIGANREEALQVVKPYKTKDVEVEADRYWNNRLATTFGNVPQLTTGNPRLERLYQNAVLTHMINRWDTLQALGQSAGFGQSTSLYPWLEGTSSFLPLTDNVFWKQMLSKLLSADWSKCRAYDNVSNIHLCDTTYAYNNVSIIEAVYRYVVATSDFAYLNENIGGSTVYEHLLQLKELDDNRPQVDGLADFGSDPQLYEYNVRCSTLTNRYVGAVISPNGERAATVKMLAELSPKANKPEYAIGLLSQSNAIWTSVSDLWNADGSKTWAGSKRAAVSSASVGSAEEKYGPFNTIYPYYFLAYPRQLNIPDVQLTDLIAKFDEFRGSYGLYSVTSKWRSLWCERTDWHGPGLYSGATGLVLEGLFARGYQDIAYSVLFPSDGKGYSYLADIPYFSQAFSGDSPRSTMNIGYHEGVSFAQAIVSGMFGVQPNADHTVFAPKIPAELLATGPATLSNIHVQSHLASIVVNSETSHSIKIDIGADAPQRSPAGAFRFGYAMNGELSIQLTNLVSNKVYQLAATKSNNPAIIKTVTASSDELGNLTTSIELDGSYVIRVQELQRSAPSR